VKSKLHDIAFLRVRCSASVLPEMCGCLLDEVARLVKTYPVALGVSHRLTDAKIICLTSVAVLCRALEMLDSFLFEFGYYLKLA
jgi:hypothetical protein